MCFSRFTRAWREAGESHVLKVEAQSVLRVPMRLKGDDEEDLLTSYGIRAALHASSWRGRRVHWKRQCHSAQQDNVVGSL